MTLNNRHTLGMELEVRVMVLIYAGDLGVPGKAYGNPAGELATDKEGQEFLDFSLTCFKHSLLHTTGPIGHPIRPLSCACQIVRRPVMLILVNEELY